MKPRHVLFALAAALLCGATRAEATGVSVDGLVAHPLHLTQADLQKFPATLVDAAFQTRHGRESGHYKGVLLWSLLEKAGIAVEPGDPRNVLRHCVLVSGRDRYMVAIAVGEIDPDLEGKPVVLAYARDGKALQPEDLRLIVPGDKHGARAVRDVDHIELK